MPKYKVGLVFDDSLDKNDGVQQYIKTYGKWLMDQGHTVHFLVGQSKNSSKNVHSLGKNISIKFNGNKLSIPYLANKKTIQNLLAKEKYDVLHVQVPYSPVLAGKIIKYAPEATAIVGTFHILPLGNVHKLGNKALGVALRRQIQRFDAICSVSAAAQKFAKAYYGIDSVVMPNMIDVGKFHTNSPMVKNKVVFLGRLVPRKGAFQLIKAVRTLPQDTQNKIEVVVAGTGSEHAKLSNYIKKHNLNYIKLIGYVDEKDKANLFRSATVAVFPSLGGESFGIVLIEAMASGAGVVIGGNNSGYESVLGKWPGTLFDPKDTEAFSRVMETFISNSDLRKQIHKSQISDVLQYDVSVVGKQLIELYSQALLQRRREVR